MVGAETVHIEIAYAGTVRQAVVRTKVPAGSTIRDAIERSGILLLYPEIDVNAAKVGIFGRIADQATAVHCGDRVEIYRALTVDPKERRRMLHEMHLEG